MVYGGNLCSVWGQCMGVTYAVYEGSVGGQCMGATYAASVLLLPS